MRTRSIQRSKAMAFIKKFLVISFALSPILILSSCTDSSTAYVDYNGAGKTVANLTECSNDIKNSSMCVEDYISGIKDPWLKNCVVSNISEKKSLSDKMNSGALDANEIKDINALIKECMYYQDTHKDTTSQGYPVFSSFVSSVAGGFVGNYLANSLLSNNINSYRDTTPDSRQAQYSKSGSGSGYRGSSVFVGGSTNTSNGKPATVSTSNGNGGKTLDTVDTQYKQSTWNIKSMKQSADLTQSTGYKLGNTGKNWSNVSSSFKASASKSSSSSSWGSSSSSKGSSSLG